MNVKNVLPNFDNRQEAHFHHDVTNAQDFFRSTGHRFVNDMIIIYFSKLHALLIIGK